MSSEPFNKKIPTGIPGLDQIALGGLPEFRSTLLSGTAGSGKTVIACQFLAEGAKNGEGVVFITFEESPDAIRSNMLGFDWPIARWEEEGLWAFVDASPIAGSPNIEVGEYDLGALMARTEHAVRKVNAKRVAMDSLGALFSQLSNSTILRREMLSITTALKRLKTTALISAEREKEHGPIARFGIEEFVVDNVMVLRNVLEAEKRRRTVEILKFRGAPHRKGEYPFTILSHTGATVISLAALELTQRSSNVRAQSGNDELDKMCGGGFFRDSIVLVSGPTGTGKTLFSTEFCARGKAGERSLLFAFEESRGQLFRNAAAWGVDLVGMEKEGRLRVECVYPEVSSLEDHLLAMKAVIDEFEPTRIAVDSLSALERVSSNRSFREFVIALTSHIKHRETLGLFTSTSPGLVGGDSVTDSHISTITDSIILLRYVETFGEMRRGLTVLKMRGSYHDKRIREYTIDGKGMHIGRAFRNVVGILTGSPSHVSASEVDRLNSMFSEDE